MASTEAVGVVADSMEAVAEDFTAEEAAAEVLMVVGAVEAAATAKPVGHRLPAPRIRHFVIATMN